MRQVKFTAIGLIAFLGVVATATADETYEARITYNPDQSATEIYESLNQSVLDTCQMQYREHSTTSLSRRFRVQTDCRRQLMDTAIENINMPDLIALHNQAEPEEARMAALQVASE